MVLTKHQNDFKIQLKHLEDDLLLRLSAAEGSFLDDTELVERLEMTKATAAEIESKVRRPEGPPEGHNAPFDSSDWRKNVIQPDNFSKSADLLWISVHLINRP